MKTNEQNNERRHFRLNIWLLLSCLLLSVLIWAATLYIEDPHGLRTGETAAADLTVTEEAL